MTKTWTPEILDSIIVYGDINFRSQMRYFKRQICIKPTDLENKFFLKHAKLRITIGQSTMKGFYDPENLKEMQEHVSELLSKSSGVIFMYNNQCYAIWSEENGFFIFNSEDTNDEGRLVARNKGASCVVRSTSMQTIIEYLVSNFRVNKQIYEVYSFAIEKIITIADELAKIAPTEKQKTQLKKTPTKTLVQTQNLNGSAAAITVESSSEKSKPGLSTILFHYQAEPTFGDRFQSSSLRDHSYLTCELFLGKAEKSKASFISSAAVVMLRICKSSLWTPATIGKIFKIGYSLHAENVENVNVKQIKRVEVLENLAVEDDLEGDASSSKQLTVAEIRERRKLKMKKSQHRECSQQQDVLITEVHPVISIGALKLVLSVESIVVGRLLSRNSSELSLQTGVDNLFKHYDYGLILSRDVVAIWREQNYFFMFDPNQCDQFRRAFDDEEKSFNSCLSCFKSTADLVQLYIENLPKDYRNSVFKICKIETCDFVEKSADWQNFKAIVDKKWILNAHISEKSDEFNAANKNNQSVCIALAALAKTRELGVMHWSSNVLDEIIRLGDEFYTGCVMKLKEKGTFNSANLKLNETLAELQLEKNAVDIYYEEEVVNGLMNSLFEGLKAFFANDDLAILTFLKNCMAVFRYQDGFFLFDSKPRNEMGKNFKTTGMFEVKYCKFEWILISNKS